jgi:quercetin dioxygenase-like cupin family protein
MSDVVQTSERELVEIVDGYKAATLGTSDSMSVGYMYFDPGTTIPEHSHESEQIGFIHRGELTFYIDGEPHELEPGDVYIVPGGVPHYDDVYDDEPVEGIYVHSPPRELPNWDG